MCTKFLQSQKGFSLVELLVGMVITMLVFSAVAGLMGASVQNWVVGTTHADLQQSARLSVFQITRDLRYAWDISVTGGNIVTYKLLDADGNQVNEEFSYSTATNALRFTANGVTNPVHDTKYTAAMVLSKEDSRTVIIDFTLTEPGSNQSVRIQTRVVCMNVPTT